MTNPEYPFDVVVTLYADAQPAPWGVREYRFGFPDGPISHDDALEAIDLARHAHRAWIEVSGTVDQAPRSDRSRRPALCDQSGRCVDA